VKVVCVDPRTDPLWSKLLDRYQSSVFHAPSWMHVLSTTYGFEVRAYVALGSEGAPIGGLPFIRVEDVLGERVMSLPFSDYCDPLVHRPEVWRQLSAQLLAEGCPITLRCLHNPLLNNDERFVVTKRAKWHGMDLQLELSTLWGGLHNSAKRAIRKAQRDGVLVSVLRSKQALRTFFELHLHTRKYKYQLLSQPYRFFEAIYRRFIEEQQGIVMLATYKDEVIGGTLFLEWGGALFYKFNASSTINLTHRPNDLLVWTGIEYAKAKGYTYLDFGLSAWDQQGLISYKRKFATEEKTISFLRYTPSVALPHHAGHLQKLLPQLTELFTDPSVPDHITEKAGDALYGFFA
jgi:CelD/BcsL family acetyltransferase involved in cellulose biosynthesis